jgi:hypothetical protein
MPWDVWGSGCIDPRFVDLGWRRCCLEDCWECLLFSEARELIWLVPTKVFADLLLSLVTLRLTERTTRTSELHCSNCTCKLIRVQVLHDWRSVSQSVCLGIDHPCGTCDQILLPVGMLLSYFCEAPSLTRGRVCSVITQWSESCRTSNHTLLSSETPPTGGTVRVRVRVTFRLTVSQSFPYLSLYSDEEIVRDV